MKSIRMAIDSLNADSKERLNHNLPSKLAIKEFCEKYAFNVPKVFFEYLEVFNGGYLGPGVVLGLNNDRNLNIETFFDYYPLLVDRKMLPIGGDGSGNTYVIVCDILRKDYGAVYFIDTMEDDSVEQYVVASNLVAFINFLVMNERGETYRLWPIDKNFMFTHDPGLADYQRGFLYIWD